MFEMDLVEIYKALGEITRLRIVMLLLDKKMCGYHIENTLNVTSHHTERGRNFQFRHYQKPSEIDAEGCGDDGKIPG